MRRGFFSTLNFRLMICYGVLYVSRRTCLLFLDRRSLRPLNLNQCKLQCVTEESGLEVTVCTCIRWTLDGLKDRDTGNTWICSVPECKHHDRPAGHHSFLPSHFKVIALKSSSHRKLWRFDF